jgi:hypothetical protein
VDSGTVALIVGLSSAVIGGLGTKLVDSANSKRKLNQDFASQIRAEQRAEVLTLRQLNKDLNSEIQDVREKYFNALQTKVDLESKIDELNLEIEELKQE